MPSSPTLLPNASLGEGLPETPTPTPIPFIGLDVQIVSVTTNDGQVTTRLRLYNGGAAPITPDDLWLALGYDIESRDSQTRRLRFIEVKGRRAGAETVTLTYNELHRALNSPEGFILALVEIERANAHPPVMYGTTHSANLTRWHPA